MSEISVIAPNFSLLSENHQSQQTTLWEKNADLWIELVSEGWDLYRDHVSLPGFLSILPEIQSMEGLDIGCGEGHNTRVLASKGAKMTGIDFTKKFVDHAKDLERKNPFGIKYFHGDATDLPFASNSFDFVSAFCSLIDIKDYRKAIREAYRALKPGGFFQFTITHPCFWTPGLEWIEDEEGKKKALACKDYFLGETQKCEWAFDGVPEGKLKGRRLVTFQYYRTLSEWINAFIEEGFQIEKLHEPKPSDDSLEKHPEIDGSLIVPFFMIVRVRKP